jgi:hypothetical protein
MLLAAALLLSACSTSAFAPTLIVPARSRMSTRHALPVASAKVLPAMYTTVGTALLVKATKAATQADGLLLATTGLLAIINLGPVDNARLASAKRACKITPPASSGAAKRKRQAARTWRSVVRLKLVGQLAGLAWMAVASNVLRGAALVMVANMAFFLCGAGGARHNDQGLPAPMSGSASAAILLVDTALSAAALLGASSPIGSTRRAKCACLFSAGAFLGAAEGLPTFVGGLTALLGGGGGAEATAAEQAEEAAAIAEILEREAAEER